MVSGPLALPDNNVNGCENRDRVAFRQCIREFPQVFLFSCSLESEVLKSWVQEAYSAQDTVAPCFLGTHTQNVRILCDFQDQLQTVWGRGLSRIGSETGVDVGGGAALSEIVTFLRQSTSVERTIHRYCLPDLAGLLTSHRWLPLCPASLCVMLLG